MYRFVALANKCKVAFFQPQKALLLGLVAAVVARWSPNDRYTYGYVRADTLAGFVNAVFLVFIAFFILSEAIEV